MQVGGPFFPRTPDAPPYFVTVLVYRLTRRVRATQAVTPAKYIKDCGFDLLVAGPCGFPRYTELSLMLVDGFANE